MSICWNCYWGWPKATKDIYNKYLRLLGGNDRILDFGPGHIVWSDENFDTDNIKSCIEHALDVPKERDGWDVYEDASAKELILAVASLRELLTVPEDIRCCEPADYDDEHPERYPPPANVEMALKRSLEN